MSIASPVAPNVTGLKRPTIDDIHTLASVRDYPCVTVLLTTKPQIRMDLTDRARLDGLLRTVHSRLTQEGVAHADTLVADLVQLADRLAEVPTDHGLALFATEHVLEYRHLPLEVEERVVVDPTFATRDIVASVQANPPYLLLLVDPDSARLFESYAGVLSEVTGSDFPLLRESDDHRTGTRPGRRRGSRPGREDGRRRELTRSFLRRADRLVHQRVTADPQPVVVMAADRVLSDYLNVTQLSGRIIALARSGGGNPSPRRLDRLVRPLLAEHLADLEAAAQDTLEARMPGREVVNGLASCWHAAVSERPELLLVEQSYALPARLSEDGTMLLPATDREHPDVIDDAIDELVELVIARGGQVRFVPDGSLRHQDRIALSVLMPRRRHRRR